MFMLKKPLNRNRSTAQHNLFGHFLKGLQIERSAGSPISKGMCYEALDLPFDFREDRLRRFFSVRFSPNLFLRALPVTSDRLCSR
jgi:hypothetical protein